MCYDAELQAYYSFVATTLKNVFLAETPLWTGVVLSYVLLSLSFVSNKSSKQFGSEPTGSLIMREASIKGIPRSAFSIIVVFARILDLNSRSLTILFNLFISMMLDQVRVFEQRLSYLYFQEHLKLDHLLLLNLRFQSHGNIPTPKRCSSTYKIRNNVWFHRCMTITKCNR